MAMPCTSGLPSPSRGPLGTLASLLICCAWLMVIQQHQASGRCTLPAGLRGHWLRARDGKVITFSSSTLRGHRVKGGSNYVEHFQCYEQVVRSSNSNTFVFNLEAKIDGTGGKVNGYFCWELATVTSSTYLLYELTPVSRYGTFEKERMVDTDFIESDSPPSSRVCVFSQKHVLPTLLYKVSSKTASDVDMTSISKVAQTCPSELLANFSYAKDGGTCLGMNSRLDFCVDRKTARIDYRACNFPVFFSEGGVLSCLANFVHCGHTFAFLVSNDAVSNTRFVCVKVEHSGLLYTYSKDCGKTDGDDYEILKLRRIGSCHTTLSPNAPQRSQSSGGFMDTTSIPVMLVVAAVICVIVLIFSMDYLCPKRRDAKKLAHYVPPPQRHPGKF